MTDLRSWFLSPKSTLASPADENPAGITHGLMGQDDVTPQPYQAPQIDLGSYWVPWRVLFNRNKTTITGS